VEERDAPSRESFEPIGQSIVRVQTLMKGRSMRTIHGILALSLIASPALAQGFLVQPPNPAAAGQAESDARQQGHDAHMEMREAHHDEAQAHRDAAVGDYTGAAQAQQRARGDMRDARQDMSQARQDQGQAHQDSTWSIAPIR
jgi:hypothetical protein